jgi:hypothetical protein
VYWVLYLAAIALALSVLNIDALNGFLAAVFAYIPNVIAAAAILLVAGAFSALVTAAVTRSMGDTPTGRVAAVAVPAVALTIAGFMALNQLQIAKDIVNITFTAFVGALAVGSALAFGLGGRQVAGQMLQDAYDKGRVGVQQARTDIQQARESSQADERSQSYAEEPEPEGIAAMPQPAFGERIEPEPRRGRGRGRKS